MIAAPTYESLCQDLEPDFFDYKKGRRTAPEISGNMWLNVTAALSSSSFVMPKKVPLLNKVKMVGILFCQPSHKLSKEQIINNLGYYHHRSGSNIDFYCSGYGAYWDITEYPDMQKVCTVNGTDWYFSPFAFNKFREDMEKRSKWRYEGEVDLLLVNAKLERNDKHICLDMTSAIDCKLEEMIRIGTITSVMSFFEDIFQYAEKQNGKDSTWGFSDKLGASHAGSALKRFVLSLLPGDLGKEAEKLQHLAIRDISS